MPTTPQLPWGFGWSHTTKNGITGWWLTLDSVSGAVSPAYYVAVMETRLHGAPGTPWRTTGIFPTLHFDTFFYNDANADLEASDGGKIWQTFLYAQTHYSRPLAPGETSSPFAPPYDNTRRGASVAIVGFVSWPFNGGLFPLYSAVIPDAADGGGGGTAPSVSPAPAQNQGDPGNTAPGPNPNDFPPLPPPFPGPPTAPPIAPIVSNQPPWDAPPANFGPDTSIGDIVDTFPGGDLVETPVDKTNGGLVTLVPVENAGVDRPQAVFAWQVPPRTLKGITRLEDGNETVNVLVAIGADDGKGDAVRYTYRDQASVNDIGEFWDTQTWSFAKDAATLAALAAAYVKKRTQGLFTYSVKPQRGSPMAFDDFGKSDTVRVWSSWRLRNGFRMSMKVNGWDIELDDEDHEILTSVYVEDPSKVS